MDDLVAALAFGGLGDCKIRPERIVYDLVVLTLNRNDLIEFWSWVALEWSAWLGGFDGSWLTHPSKIAVHFQMCRRLRSPFVHARNNC